MAQRSRRERPGPGRPDRIAATLLAAAALALAVERGIALVGGVALVPFLLALRGTRTREACGLGVLLGTAYALLLARWIPPALAALGSSPGSAWAGLALAAAWVGPPVFVVVAAIERALRTRPAWLRALALGAAVFVAEWTIGRAWWGVPWGLLGHSQRDALGVAQLAVVGGVPAISLLLVSVGAALADACHGRRGAGRLAAACLAAWLALALGGLPVAEAVRRERPESAASPPSAWLVVQPELPRGERWAPELQALNLHRVRAAVARARAARPGRVDAIVLPENLLTSPIDAHPDLAQALAAWVDTLGVPLLTGLVFTASPPAPGRYRSAAVWIEPGRGITARLDKERAVPVVESARAFAGEGWLAARLGGAARWDKVEEAGPVTSFAGPIPVAPLLCYEALFPAIAARRRGPVTAALVQLADAGWLPSAAARRRLAQLARFRAIEQRAPLVRVALGGPSLHVDEFGRVIGQHRGAGGMRATVAPSPAPRIGERMAVLALPLLAFGAVAALRRPSSPASSGTPTTRATRRGVPYLRRPLGAGRDAGSQAATPPESRKSEPRRVPCDVSKTAPS